MKEIILNKKRFFIHFLVWVIIVFIGSIQLYSAKGNINYQFFYRIIADIIIFYINYSLLVPLLLLKRKKIFFLISVITLVFLSYMVFTYFLQKPDFIPDFVTKRPVIIVFISMHIIIGIAIRMYEEWIFNERNKKEIELQKNLTELEALKNQLNPHFLFNSLNSVYSLAVKKSNDTPEAIITLSELLRYMLYQTNDDLVLLKHEFEYIENYIKLQRLRIANNQNVKININGNVSTQKIRPLLFISYIENAFKHGTDFIGNTEVKINITVKGDDLQFRCVNLIGDRSSDKVNSGIGMKNTIERLQLLYPDRYWLSTLAEDNRFVVDLKLKLE